MVNLLLPVVFAAPCFVAACPDLPAWVACCLVAAVCCPAELVFAGFEGHAGRRACYPGFDLDFFADRFPGADWAGFPCLVAAPCYCPVVFAVALLLLIQDHLPL